MGDLIANTDNPFDIEENAILDGVQENIVNIYVGEQLPDNPNYPVRVELGIQPVVHTYHLDPRYCSTLSPQADDVREELAKYNELVEKYRDGIIPHHDSYTQTPRTWSAPRATQTVPTPIKSKSIYITQTILIDTAPNNEEINTTIIGDENGTTQGSHSRPGTSNSQHSVNSTASMAKSGDDDTNSVAGSVASVGEENEGAGNNSDAVSDTGTVMTMMTTATAMTGMTSATAMTAGSLNSLGSLVENDDEAGGDNMAAGGYSDMGQGTGIDPEMEFVRLCSKSSAFLNSLLLAEDILNQTFYFNLYSEFDGRDIIDMINNKIDEFSTAHMDNYLSTNIQDVTMGTSEFVNNEDNSTKEANDDGEDGTKTSSFASIDDRSKKVEQASINADSGLDKDLASNEGYSLDFIQLPADDTDIFYTPIHNKDIISKDEAWKNRDATKVQSKMGGDGNNNFNYMPLELHGLWEFYTPELAGMTVTAVQFAPCYDNDVLSLSKYLKSLKDSTLGGMNKLDFISSSYISKLRSSLNNVDSKTPLLAVGYASGINTSIMSSGSESMGVNTNRDKNSDGNSNSSSNNDVNSALSPPDLGLLVVWYRNPQRPFNVFTLRSGVISIAWQPESPGMIAVGTRKGDVSIFVCKQGNNNIGISSSTHQTGNGIDKDHDAAGFSIPSMSTSSSSGGGSSKPGGAGGGMGGSGGSSGGNSGSSSAALGGGRGRHIGTVWGLGWTKSSTNEKDKDKEAKGKVANAAKKNALHQNEEDDSSINTDLLLSISSDGKVIERSLKRNLEFHEILQLISTKNHPASNSANSGPGNGSNSSVSRRLASGTALAVSPVDPGTYLLGTDSGSIHRASRTYTEQYLDTYDGNGHTNTVSSIEWCPFAVQDIFGSCSATEGCVKIWTIESNDSIYTLVADGATSSDQMDMPADDMRGLTNRGRSRNANDNNNNSNNNNNNANNKQSLALNLGGTNSRKGDNQGRQGSRNGGAGGAKDDYDLNMMLSNNSGSRLTCMCWCPFSPTILLTGSSVGVVAIWDMSVSLMTPVFQINVSDITYENAPKNDDFYYNNNSSQNLSGRESVTCITFSSNSPAIAVGMSTGRVIILRMNGIEASVMWKRLLPQEVIERGYERIHSMMTSNEE